MGSLHDARSLVAGTGRYERGSAFEPLLVPLVAGHVPASEVWFACYAGSLAARPNPRLGWPLLGLATARQVAPLVTDDLVWNAVQTLPDLALYLDDEMIESLAFRPVHERISRRLAMHRGETPSLDLHKVVSQPWEATGVTLYLEYSDASARRDAVDQIATATEDVDHMRKLMFRAVIGPYAEPASAVASSALALLQPDVPGWYWCTLAAHLGCGGHQTGDIEASGHIPAPWAAHFDRLLDAGRNVNPLLLPAVAHPFGDELVDLIGQMAVADRASFAREVLNGVVDSWAIDTTLDDVPVLFATTPAATPIITTPAAPVLAPPVGPAVVIDTPVVVESPVVIDTPVVVETTVDASAALVVHMTVRTAGERSVGVGGFVRGSDHHVTAWIAADVDLAPAGIHASVNIGDPSAVDCTDRSSMLTVVMTHDDDTLTRPLVIQSGRSCTDRPIPFTLWVRPDEQFVVASIVLIRDGRVLHHAVLTGATAATVADVEGMQLHLR